MKKLFFVFLIVILVSLPFISFAEQTYPNQQWDDYPDSPVLTETYPYQAIILYGSDTFLICSSSKLFHDYSFDEHKLKSSLGGSHPRYSLDGTNWVSVTSQSVSAYKSIFECNYDIYTKSSCDVVYKSETFFPMALVNPLLLQPLLPSLTQQTLVVVGVSVLLLASMICLVVLVRFLRTHLML